MREALAKVDGFGSVERLDVGSGVVEVTYDPSETSPEDLVETINGDTIFEASLGS